MIAPIGSGPSTGIESDVPTSSERGDSPLHQEEIHCHED